MPKKRGKRGEKGEAWLKVELFAPDEMIDALTDFLTEIGAHGTFQEFLEPRLSDGPSESSHEPLKTHLPFDDRIGARLSGIQTYIDSLTELFPELQKPTFRTEVIRDPGWGEAWKQYFKPFRATRHIVIKPTWEDFAPTERDVVIEIDPGMAFGTGQHESTRMCLDAIETIRRKNPTFEKWDVLDVGTGTGILGIASAKLGAEKVLGVDIDPKATAIARENVLINRVANQVKIATRNIATLVKPYRLVVANLTAGLLIELRSHLVRLTRSGGILVISGIIQQDQPAIQAAFLGNSLALSRLITAKEWLCYVLKREVGRP